MTYEEAVAAFEGKFKHVVSDGIHTNDARDEHGNEFQAIYANNKGGKAGIPAQPIMSETSSEAFDKWLENALDSIPGGMITLYWRVMPQCLSVPGRDGCYVFARASFSSKEPKPKPVEEAPATNE